MQFANVSAASPGANYITISTKLGDHLYLAQIDLRYRRITGDIYRCCARRWFHFGKGTNLLGLMEMREWYNEGALARGHGLYSAVLERLEWAAPEAVRRHIEGLSCAEKQRVTRRRQAVLKDQADYVAELMRECQTAMETELETGTRMPFGTAMDLKVRLTKILDKLPR